VTAGGSAAAAGRLTRPGTAGVGAVTLCACLAAGALLLWWAAFGPIAAASAAATAGTGTAGEIRGTVFVRSFPAHPVAGQRVRLEIVERGSTSTRDTTADPQGRFTFAGLPLGGLRVFLVQVDYRGVPYTRRVELTPAAPTSDVPFAVFESTEDRAAVHGTIAFGVLEPLQRGLRVSIIQRLENDTDRAVVVTEEDPLVFPLPDVSPSPRGTEPIEFVGGWHNPQAVRGAITDAIPVLPGVMEVAYAFGFEPRATSATLRWRFPYGATDVELLVAADRGIGVSGSDLHAAGAVTERGQRYARWSGGPVNPGAAVSVRLDGLPVFADHWPEIVAGVFALALACGLAAALRRTPAPVAAR